MDTDPDPPGRIVAHHNLHGMPDPEKCAPSHASMPLNLICRLPVKCSSYLREDFLPTTIRRALDHRGVLTVAEALNHNPSTVCFL